MLRGIHEGLTRRGTAERSAWCVRSIMIGLGVVSAFSGPGRADAQDARLTVRPHEMVPATRSPAAGEYPLTPDSSVIVSVAPQCAGAHRCPLLVQLPGGGISARQMTDWLRPVADKYGLLLLTLTEYAPAQLDSAMQATLRRFAVDPAKIAIAGRCASGGAGTRFGIDNPDVFTRVISVSGGAPVQGIDPKNKTTEFLIDRGFMEAGGMFKTAQALRADGHPVTLAVALRGHEHQTEDYDFVGHWLRQSWAQPNPAARPKPVVVADPMPALTSQVMTKMTDFWMRFAKEPDSIRVAGRRTHLREVSVPVGVDRALVWMTDMAALATTYPSVAADLKAAELTVKEHDAYRVALLSAMLTNSAEGQVEPIDTASVLAKNMVFLESNQLEFQTLRDAGIANPASVRVVDQTATIIHPKIADDMGAMGIWRTP